MRIWLLIVVGVLLAAAGVCINVSSATEPNSAPAIWINEFLADNDHVIADELGEYDDVLELYNASAVEVSLGGMYLTDDLAEPTKFRITDSVAIPPDGFLLFWADSSPEQGIYHTNFALSKGGESIGLFDTDANANVLVDAYTFGAQALDVSEGRCPDGGSSWFFFSTPSMGGTNEPCGAPPSISGTQQSPAFPQAREVVTVTATITDDGVVVTATLWYSADVGYVPVAMAALAGDEFGGIIPGQTDGTWVRYYVEAEDDAGWKSTDPAGAPAAAYSYVSGYEPPPVVLNELMADNSSTLEDPDEPGEYPDWFELYNPGLDTLNLGGLYLADDLADPVQFPISDGVTIEPGGFLVFYADDEPQQGPLHTTFKLGAGGETLALYGAEGKVLIDVVTFPEQQVDVSYARRPDGTGAWVFQRCATPGRSNESCQRIWLALVTRGAGPPPLPLRIDCGSDVPYETADGTAYLPDHAWVAGAPYGYVGGYPDLPSEWWEENPVGNTNDPNLYKSLRRDWQEYRVGGIANGDYLLTLRFNEQIYHGPGFSVFDVAIEGQTVLDDLDVWAEIGRYYALDARFAVSLADGELNVSATPVIGEPHLAALGLVARAPDTIPPATPTGLVPISSYGAILLDWADSPEDDLAGYHVYRADQPQGPYTRLTSAHPDFHSRYQDRVPVVHVPYYYCVTAVDVYGNESAQSAPVSSSAIELGEATLPLYQLAVTPDQLAILYADPWADFRVPATFASAGDVYPAEVRFRGSVSRSWPKKSWKVVFPASSPVPNQDRINVNGNWLDPSLIHAKLANDLFEAAGLRPPEAKLVLLALNGEYLGVYTRNEQVDEGFLLHTGRNPQASIYEVLDRFGELLPNEAKYRAYYEKKTNGDLGYEDLIAFIELLNNTPDDEFAAELAAAMDVEAFLDYYALMVLTGNIDSARHNIYLVHDLATDKWELVPWDLELTFSDPTPPIDMGTEDHPERYGGWNILRTRVLQVPQFRAYYCDRLAEYMDTIFTDAAMYPRIDALYGDVEQDGIRDWLKPLWEQSSALTGSPGHCKDFVSARKRILVDEMSLFCPTP
jgi:spore coat protein CotH